MTKIKIYVKYKLEKFNSKLDRVIIASQGLYILIRDEGNKQLNELVIAGEAKKATEAKGGDVKISKGGRVQREDMNISISNIRSASLGIIAKAKESSEQVFNELVDKGGLNLT